MADKKAVSETGETPVNKNSEKPTNTQTDAVFLSADHRKRMVSLLRDTITWRTLALISGCVDCGLCTDACHYYLATNDPSLIPAAKMRNLAQILRKNRVLYGSKLPFGSGTREVSAPGAENLARIVFENCTLCGRCGMTCPMGINAGPIFLTARTVFSQLEKVPKGLDEPIQTALEMGNYVGLSLEDFTESIEWIAEEMGDELEIDDFTIPVDQKDAAILYIPHPLEVRDNPFLITAAVAVFHAAKENYTLSTRHFDVANYAYYAGNTEYMLRIVKKLLQAREELNAKSIVLTPCGHGYRVLRWEAERVLGYRFPFERLTFSELIDRYLRDGRIAVKKDTLEGPITYHDPCNIGRYGGVIEQPRNIVKALTSEFVEMEPTGALNFCCGGGGGLSATGDYGQLRLQIGKVKAEQIEKTGAKVVVTNCYNCLTQIGELNRKYNLGVKVKSIVELVADSLDTGSVQE